MTTLPPFNNNFFLSGFMGVGKSAVGAQLARCLRNLDVNWNFVDLDEHIESVSGKKIAFIFQEYGEAYFRDLETQCLKEICQRQYQVVALGGGSVIREENRKWINSAGILLYLQADLATFVNRLEVSSHCRPLLTTQDSESTNSLSSRIRGLMKARQALYEKACWSIETTDCTVDEVVKKILARFVPVSVPLTETETETEPLCIAF